HHVSQGHQDRRATRGRGVRRVVDGRPGAPGLYHQRHRVPPDPARVARSVPRRRRPRAQADPVGGGRQLAVPGGLPADPARAALLSRLKSSNKDIERGRAIGQWRDKYPDPKHVPEVRRWLSQVGEHADDLLVLLPAPRSSLPSIVASIRAAKDPLTVKHLAVKGDDLLAAGVRPGPDVGETLERLLAEVLEDPTRNTRAYLLSRV